VRNVQTKAVERIRIHILCSVSLFPKLYHLEIKWILYRVEQERIKTIKFNAGRIHK